jgi:hypothetical protein
MTVFRPLEARTIRWAPCDGTGLEHFSIRRKNDAIVARSVVIGQRDAAPYGVQYTVVCDDAWRVRSLDLATTDDRSVHLRADGNGNWSDNSGNALTDFCGCIDIDLAGSPFTNTLPVRRLGLDVEQGAVELKMVFIPFEDFSPFVDGQRYTCLESSRLFRFEAVDGSFSAEIVFDEDGLVLDYPPLFTRVS